MAEKNLKSRVETGISPKQFVEGMTKNQEKFREWGEGFEWPSEDDKSFFEGFGGSQKLRCLIIGADWCGDVVRNVPVVLKLTEAAQIPTEMFVIEQHYDFIDEFLTMGGRSIPVVLFIDPDGNLVARWGPRPRKVQEVMEEFKANNPDREAPTYDENLKTARAEMMRRYGDGTSYHADIVREIRSLLQK